MDSQAYLKDLGDELRKLTDVKPETIRLIVPRVHEKGSNLLFPFSDKHSCLSLQEASILEGKPIRMMGVTEDETDRVLKDAKTDMRILGFEEEERRLRQRMLYAPHTTIKLPQGPYIFCDFRTLEIPGVELNPPPSDALKIMHMLAADPGIVAIMNKHRWRVGIMTELAPVGYVGVSPKCVLGFNKNHGEEISLRLRTDDLKGFRKYERIKNTLLHELAHMVHSEHDENFYALDKQLNQEAVSLDWTKSRGQTLSGIKNMEGYKEDCYSGQSENFSQKLGGSKSDQLVNVRASSLAAAYRRLFSTTANDVGVSKVHEEPHPDDLLVDIRDEAKNPNSAKARNTGTDPDDQSASRNKLERDPDDAIEDGTSKPYTTLSGVLSKPGDASGPEHQSEMMKISDSLAQPDKVAYEPDPDDNLETEAKHRESDNLKGSNGIMICDENLKKSIDINLISETSDVQIQKDMPHREPDPDDSLANEPVEAKPDPDNAEPDPNDNMVHSGRKASMNADEPDPDDQEIQRIQDSVTIICDRLKKAIDVLQAEANPVEATKVLQTLFKIIRNVIEHPDDTKFKRLRKGNSAFQRNVLSYKAAVEMLFLVGFVEDVVSDGIGKPEACLVLKRNDPGLLWLAKASLEARIAASSGHQTPFPLNSV